MKSFYASTTWTVCPLGLETFKRVWSLTMSGLHYLWYQQFFFPKNLIPGCQFKKLLYCLGHKIRSPTRSGFEGLSSTHLPRLPLSAPTPRYSPPPPPTPTPRTLWWNHPLFLNPLNPKIKIWILICCPNSFPTEAMRRSW